MTVIGISGCTALLVTGFGLKNSINDIMDKQFDEIFIYDGQVFVDTDKKFQKKILIKFWVILHQLNPISLYSVKMVMHLWETQAEATKPISWCLKTLRILQNLLISMTGKPRVKSASTRWCRYF